MSDLHKAAQQALEALDMYVIETDSEFQRKAITALRAALVQQAEPVPQPGVWMHPWPPVKAQQAEPSSGRME